MLLRETLGDWPEGQAAPLKRPSKSQGLAALLKAPFRGGRQAQGPALPAAADAPAAATRNLLLSGAATAAISALRAGLEGQLPTIRQQQLSEQPCSASLPRLSNSNELLLIDSNVVADGLQVPRCPLQCALLPPPRGSFSS